MTRKRIELTAIDRRALRQIVLRLQDAHIQAGFLEHNGAGDEIRFGMIAVYARKAMEIAERGALRYERNRAKT